VLRKLAYGSAAAIALWMAPAPVQAQGGFSDSFLFLKAVREGDGGEVDKLLSGSGHTMINTKDRDTGNTALHIVTTGRNLDWLRFFIGKGARVDMQNKEGMSPLALAAQIGWVEGASVLLAKKAAIDLPNSRGETPLILAVQKRDLQMVRLLLGQGADPKKTDRVAGLSALDYAKRDARSGAILKLLEAPPAEPAAEKKIGL